MVYYCFTQIIYILTFFLTFYLAFYLTFSLAYVGVKARPTASGAGRGGRSCTFVKIDPHLAGGEKEKRLTD
jgi:hypothetical protein